MIYNFWRASAAAASAAAASAAASAATSGDADVPGWFGDPGDGVRLRHRRRRRRRRRSGARARLSGQSLGKEIPARAHRPGRFFFRG